MDRLLAAALLMVGMFVFTSGRDKGNESNPPGGPGQDQLDRNKALIRRIFEEWINQKNLSSVDEIVSPDFVNHPSLQDVPLGPEGMKKSLPLLLAAFPDVHVTIET